MTVSVYFYRANQSIPNQNMTERRIMSYSLLEHLAIAFHPSPFPPPHRRPLPLEVTHHKVRFQFQVPRKKEENISFSYAYFRVVPVYTWYNAKVFKVFDLMSLRTRGLGHTVGYCTSHAEFNQTKTSLICPPRPGRRIFSFAIQTVNTKH